MGKTYRRNENAAAFSRGVRSERRDFKRRTQQPKEISPEWVLKRMEKHINYVLDYLVRNETIPKQDREDCKGKIVLYLLKAIPQYNPERKNDDGKSASAVHYFTLVVDGIAANICDYYNFRKQYYHPVEIVSAAPEEVEKDGAVSVESEALSDHCKSIKELDFKMDVETLYKMLTPEEANFLNLRMAGYTDKEIVEDMGVPNRDYFTIHLLPEIRRKARICGFYPPSEVRAGKDR